ncbi:MAG: glycine/sarcosine/betaine reductase complex component C subunit alpha [Bacillota bacterium]|nr:glycine/sarcosine/betaine reductase complex component C subunit alpha [Bacillota bacterium]
MSEAKTKRLIAETFLEMASGLESGEYGKKPVIGIAAEGSEHGREELLEGARQAEARGCRTVLIEGEDVHKRMEELLAKGEIQGAVTMHYPFPIGVATIGKVVTPGRGKAMYLAATTGTSDTDRVSAMVKNAVYGIIAAKASGTPEPTVGIANIDGARQTEKALLKLAEGGYPIRFAESARADGGIVMRGNDLLLGSADVMVMDSLTGNLMMKMFSSGSTGGSYEATGWGYGPGIGQGYEPIIMIVSRASGAPVIAGACEYAAQLVKQGVGRIAAAEFAAAEKAGLKEILKELKAPKESAAAGAPVAAPPKEVVTAQIPGIEVTDLEDAVEALWAQGVYAESGMGCTGPIVLISEANKEKAAAILEEKGYIK